MKLIKIISEIKNINSKYEEAAKFISNDLRKSGISNISKEVPGFKYGAWSGEVPEVIVRAMDEIMGMNLDLDNQDWYNKMDKFIEELKTFKLIYIEW
jgi:hypothetical protein